GGARQQDRDQEENRLDLLDPLAEADGHFFAETENSQLARKEDGPQDSDQHHRRNPQKVVPGGADQSPRGPHRHTLRHFENQGNPVGNGIKKGGYGRSRQDEAKGGDRKSTRLNSSHVKISYAASCLNKKTGAHAAPHAEGTRVAD